MLIYSLLYLMHFNYLNGEHNKWDTKYIRFMSAKLTTVVLSDVNVIVRWWGDLESTEAFLSLLWNPLRHNNQDQERMEEIRFPVCQLWLWEGLPSLDPPSWGERQTLPPITTCAQWKCPTSRKGFPRKFPLQTSTTIHNRWGYKVWSLKVNRKVTIESVLHPS